MPWILDTVMGRFVLDISGRWHPDHDLTKAHLSTWRASDSHMLPVQVALYEAPKVLPGLTSLAMNMIFATDAARTILERFASAHLQFSPAIVHMPDGKVYDQPVHLLTLLPFSLLFWAQTQIPSGLASILNATTPIFSIAVAHFLLADERMATNKAIGILFGFLGVVVLLGGDILNGASLASLGMLACLGAALSYGFAGVFGRRFKAMRLTATQVAFGQLVATTLMMVPILTVVDRPWTLAAPSLPVVASLLALAIISTALAYVIFFRILASAGAVNVALVTLLVPVSAILLGTLVLGERLALRHYAGMGLIAVGLLAIDGRILDHVIGRRDTGAPG